MITSKIWLRALL